VEPLRLKMFIELALSYSSQGAAPCYGSQGTPASEVCHEDQKRHSTHPQSLPVSPIPVVYCNQH
jgi:hypothetical protein